MKFHGSICHIIDENENIIGLATKRGGLFYLDCQIDYHRVNACAIEKPNHTKIWHQCYGHLNIMSLKKLASSEWFKS